MKKFNQIFFKGLIFVLPVTLTFYFLFWAGLKAESIFGELIVSLVGEQYYLPGFGVVLTFIFVFFVGLLVSHYITAKLISWISSILEKVPLIKVIYNPLKDLMALLPGKSQNSAQKPKVVLVETLPGIKLLGLVTREDLDELPNHQLISVYVPYSYMLGGVTLLVSPDKVEQVNIPVDQALKLGVTAWIKAREE
jgi:uncharacterized membrane protein